MDKKSTLKNLNKSIDGGGGNTYHKLSDLVETERGTLNIATNSVALTDFLISQEDPWDYWMNDFFQNVHNLSICIIH